MQTEQRFYTSVKQLSNAFPITIICSLFKKSSRLEQKPEDEICTITIHFVTVHEFFICLKNKPSYSKPCCTYSLGVILCFKEEQFHLLAPVATRYSVRICWFWILVGKNTWWHILPHKPWLRPRCFNCIYCSWTMLLFLSCLFILSSINLSPPM